ncbi:MAG: hypothetical protein HWE18_00215 [Gammaproteobacteria bacterium]|nr:hypothetical protein [Gammaproteobacteria bacterium]
MLKRSIHWLMIILIAWQSVGAFADVHSNHQDGVEHLVFEHEHTQSQPHAIKQPMDDNDQYDCHHCCHCHGAHSNFISTSVHSNAIYGRSPQHSFHPTLAVTKQEQSLYRPPRA